MLRPDKLSNDIFPLRLFPYPAVECIGEDLGDDLNETLSVKAGLLFVLDESGSVSRQDYEKTKVFVKDIITQFP
jgi:hypothetical protein